MNNKQFKKILRESLSNGADVFFEEEGISSSIALGPDMDEDPDKEAKENTIESQTINNLKSAASDAETIKKSGKMVPDEFARTVAYYFIGMYHDENESWNLSLRNNSIFNRNLEAVLESIEERDDNILCKFSEVLDWVTTFGAYVSPDIFVASVRTQKNEATLNKINKALVDIKKGNFSLSSGNRKILNRLVQKVGKFEPSKCDSGDTEGAEEEAAIRTKKQQPMSLESLKAMIKKTDARDYAHKIINALKTDMKDLRVKVNEAREQTPLLTNTIKVLQSIPDKDIQKAALKPILDFFRVNNLQINGKTQSKLTKAGILSTQGDEPEADTPSEEDEDFLKTPDEKQTIRNLYISLRKISGLNDFAKQIIDVLRKDVPKSLSTSLGLRKALKEEEGQTVIRSAENIINLLKTIKDQGKPQIAKMAYIVISRYLSRNGIKLTQRDANVIKFLKVIPNDKAEMMFLLNRIKPLERNLEEQRYNMLLKRLNIK